MPETAPTRQTRLTDVEFSSPPGAQPGGYGYVWRLWAVVAIFSTITLARSTELGIPLRDPDGAMFQGRLTKALVLVVVAAILEAVVRSVARAKGRGWSPRAWVGVLRERWTWKRVVLVVTGLLGYHLVYLQYRNLKSWNAFNPLRDDNLLSFDKALFLGHSPAVLLHDVLGQSLAADVLGLAYGAFTYVIVVSLVTSLALIAQVRRAYVFLSAATWLWILGTASYYVLPSLGPFTAAPQEFSGLKPTVITGAQAEYLTERAHFLANPGAPDAFVSLGAFASLHVGFTTLVFLVLRYYGLRRTSRVFACYLVAVILATVYFGWHYVADDLAGAILALGALQLGKWTVSPPWQRGEPG